MADAWPGTFPFIVNPEDFREAGPTGNVIRSPMERGTTKQRRRFTNASRPVEGSTSVMTTAQVALFETFFRTTLKDGTLPFTATNPRTGATETFKFSDTYEVIHLLDNKARIAMKLEQTT